MILRGPELKAPTSATVNAALKAPRAPRFGLVFVDAQRERAAHLRGPRSTPARGAWRRRCSRAACSPATASRWCCPTGPDFLDAFFGALLAGAVPVPLYPPVRLGPLDEYARAHRAHARASSGAASCSATARVRAAARRRRRARAAARSAARPSPSCSRAPSRGRARRSPPDDARRSSSSRRARRSTRSRSRSPTRNLLAQVAALKQLHARRLDGTARHAASRGCRSTTTWGSSAACSLAVVLARAAGADPARALPRAAGALAARDLAAPRHRLARAQLRLRPVPQARPRRRARRASTSPAGASRSTAPSRSPPALLRRFAERFARCGFDREALLPVYGLSEASLAVTFTARARAARARGRPARSRSRRGDAGRRASSRSARRCPASRSRCAATAAHAARATVGRIFVRGPSVMRGYFGNPEATARGARRRLARHRRPRLRRRRRAVRAAAAPRTWSSSAAPTTRRRSSRSASTASPGVRAGCAVAVGFVPEGGDGEALRHARRARAGADGPRRSASPRAVVAAHRRSARTPCGCSRRARCRAPRAASCAAREALRRLLAGELAPPQGRERAQRSAPRWRRSTLAFARSAARRRDASTSRSSAAAPAGLAAAIDARAARAARVRRARAPARARRQGLRRGAHARRRSRALEALGATRRPRRTTAPLHRHPLRAGGRPLRRGAAARARRPRHPPARARTRRCSQRARAGWAPSCGAACTCTARRADASRHASRSTTDDGALSGARCSSPPTGCTRRCAGRRGSTRRAPRPAPLRPAPPLRARAVGPTRRGALRRGRRGLRHPGRRRAGSASPSSGEDGRRRRPIGFDALLARFPRARKRGSRAPRSTRSAVGAGPLLQTRQRVVAAAASCCSATPPATSTRSPARACRWRSIRRRCWRV